MQLSSANFCGSSVHQSFSDAVNAISERHRALASVSGFGLESACAPRNAIRDPQTLAAFEDRP